MKLSHPDQQAIKHDCANMYQLIPMFAEQDLKHALEFGLTFYCM
jgi:type III secretory pathway component EscR